VLSWLPICGLCQPLTAPRTSDIFNGEGELRILGFLWLWYILTELGFVRKREPYSPFFYSENLSSIFMVHTAEEVRTQELQLGIFLDNIDKKNSILIILIKKIQIN
jgi:hypothetical protein